jgi:phosphoribosyl 1,2-cyclic phosphodiesterase
VLDAGSGIRAPGDSVAGRPLEADIVLSHDHLDHIHGLPFFAHLYDPATTLRLHGPPGIAEAIRSSLRQPPMLDLDRAARAWIEWHDLLPSKEVALAAGPALGDIALDHPGGALGLRLRHRGVSLCYISDAELRPGPALDALAGLAAACDLLICDASYTEADWAARVGRGHSTWRVAVRLVEASGAGRLMLFHHEPTRDDNALDAIAAEAATLRAGTVAAREGDETRLAARP